MTNFTKYTFCIFTAIVLFACGTPYKSEKSDALIGTWTLVKEKKGDKEINFSGVPTASKFVFNENGYYVYYDEINNKKIVEDGVAVMQDNLKGQYEKNDNEIVLHIYHSDTLIKKYYKIVSISNDSLIIYDQSTKKTSYFKK